MWNFLCFLLNVECFDGNTLSPIQHWLVCCGCWWGPQDQKPEFTDHSGHERSEVWGQNFHYEINLLCVNVNNFNVDLMITKNSVVAIQIHTFFTNSSKCIIIPNGQILKFDFFPFSSGQNWPHWHNLPEQPWRAVVCHGLVGRSISFSTFGFRCLLLGNWWDCSGPYCLNMI